MRATFAEFIDDPAFLGGDFAAPSWDTWKITLRAMLGEPLTDAERQRFVEVAGREPPPNRVKEAWFAIGRRGGKDSAIGALVTYLAVCGAWQPHLARGERATIFALAVDKSQARVLHDRVSAYFDEIPLLRDLVDSADDGVISLKNQVDIVIAAANFRAIRGRTVAAVVMDELAFWRDEAFASPDVEVYRALTPSLLTLRAAGVTAGGDLHHVPQIRLAL